MNRTFKILIAFSAMIAVLYGGFLFWTLRSAPELPRVSRVPEFSLTSESREPFTRSGLAAKISIVDFIFTSCAGTCPMMSTKMSELQAELAHDPLVQFVSFSVDPETDTPEALSAYGAGYGAIGGKWTFLTGDRKAIFALTRDGFHLGLDTDGENAVIHSQKFVLVDANADIRGYYDSDDAKAMKQLIADARALAARGGS